MDKFSTGESTGADSCVCKTGFKWNTQKAECVIDCLTVPHSTGQSIGFLSCECSFVSIWNPATLTCDQNCNNIEFSTRQVDPNGGCLCI